MAVSVMARCGPGLASPFSSSTRRVRAQPAAGGARPPVSFVRVVRPKLSPSQAFYRGGSCYNGYDEESAKHMMSEMERMAKQWRETGKVSGGFFWPGGGFTYRADRSDGPAAPGSSPSSSPSNSSAGPSLPLDVVSTDGFYLLYADVPADVPGLAKADLSIKLSKECVLTLSGERRPPVEDGFTQQERPAGPFSRAWALPEDADSEGISAKVAEGVLTVTVPKKQQEPEVDEAQEISIN